jgi:hypothetical protein
MRRNQILALAGALAFLVAAVALVPARLAGSAVSAAGGAASGLTGTLWAGQARTVTLAGLRLEQVDWQLRPTGLLRGELAAQVEAKLPGGFLSGLLFWKPGGQSGARGLEGGAPLVSLAPGAAALAGDSQVSVRLEALTLKDGWISTLVGTLELGQVTLPIPALRGKLGPGAYAVTFDARDLPAGEPLTGVLKDVTGPLEVSGSLQLRPPREYELVGVMTPRANTPPELTGALRTLGQRTPEGGYGFSLAGTF